MSRDRSNSYYVLKFNRNWADEFDCQGFAVINGVHYDMLERLFHIPDIRDNYMSFMFGTNEGWEDEFTYLEFWDDLEKVDITSSIFWSAMLMEVFADDNGIYGIFPDFDYLFEDFDGIDLVEDYFDMLDREEFKLNLRKVINV